MDLLMKITLSFFLKVFWLTRKKYRQWLKFPLIKENISTKWKPPDIPTDMNASLIKDVTYIHLLYLNKLLMVSGMSGCADTI